jgi:hypothetical protein
LSHVDVWTATTRRHLQRTTVALLDLIDCGPPEPVVNARKPSESEQDQTYRTGDRYTPTPPGRTRHTGVSRPVEAAVYRWEAEAQRATTWLFEVVSEAVNITTTFGLTVTDEHGRNLKPPVEPETAHNGRGELLVDVGPVACRRAVWEASVWLGAVVDALGARWARMGDDSSADRARYLERLLAGLSRRLGAQVPQPGRTVPCRSCHREMSKAEGRRDCGACRTAASRARARRSA